MVLLDTCALLWLVAGHRSLSEHARRTIRRHRGQLYISAISALEIGIKVSKGALQLPLPVAEWWSGVITLHGLTPIAIDAETALAAAALPRLHADPADRILIAEARRRGCVLLTPDPAIQAYPDLRVEW